MDILNAIDGLTFPEAYRNKLALKLEEIQIPYIGLQGLIANKKASGRSQDITDLKQLAKLSQKRINAEIPSRQRPEKTRHRRGRRARKSVKKLL